MYPWNVLSMYIPYITYFLQSPNMHKFKSFDLPSDLDSDRIRYSCLTNIIQNFYWPVNQCGNENFLKWIIFGYGLLNINFNLMNSVCLF